MARHPNPADDRTGQGRAQAGRPLHGRRSGRLLRYDPFNGPKRTIVHNDTHSRPRQVSNVTHEISHGLLLHPPTPPLDADGLTDGDRAMEEEATWLAGILLISEPSALLIARKGWSLDAAARVYGVSAAMVRFRVNVTGARRRVA